jgi:HTH-type transcriptional regulator/antitoxin HigA
MNTGVIEEARALFEKAGFIGRIQDQTDYEQALALMDELIEDYDRNRPLIEVLSNSIERWEASADEFAEFNRQVDAMDDGVAVLRLLMDQHGLTGSDLPELGSKSLVSKILKGERSLTRRHIEALSARFGISPTLFFARGV